MAEGYAGREQMSWGAEVDVGQQLEREFYQDLLQAVQKWEQAFAVLEEDEQRRIVSTAAQSGLLQATQIARAAVARYERDRKDE